jgi:hypothetical protein
MKTTINGTGNIPIGQAVQTVLEIVVVLVKQIQINHPSLNW